MSQYAPAVLQTITNPDGSVSLIQVDPNSPIITLPDGTTAQVVSYIVIVTLCRFSMVCRASRIGRS